VIHSNRLQQRAAALLSGVPWLGFAAAQQQQRRRIFMPLPRSSACLCLFALGGCGEVVLLDDAVLDATALAGDAASRPPARRRGTIIIAELAATNPVSDPEQERSGAYVSIRYLDPDQADIPAYPANHGAPLATPAPDTCAVWLYDVAAGQAGPPGLDEGSIHVHDTFSPIGACAYDAARSAYACKYLEGLVAHNIGLLNSISVREDERVVVQLKYDALLGKDPAGMFVELIGFAYAGNNGTFPITAASIGYDYLEIENRNALSELVESAGPGYTILAGAGPTWARKPFLGAANRVALYKTAGPTVPGFFNVQVPAAGAGIRLEGGSAKPHELPSTAADVKFVFPLGYYFNTKPPGVATQFVLAGRTTDAPVTAGQFMDMPPPAGKQAVFECRSELDTGEITLPRAALQTILDAAPTRIETRLLIVTSHVERAPDNPDITTEILVGHGLVGYTDVTGPLPE
jgi:hypothetical protein